MPEPTKQKQPPDLAICLGDIKAALREIQEIRLMAAPEGGSPPSAPAARAIALIDALIQDLPKPRDKWPTEQRASWLRTAASLFEYLYTDGDHVIRIEVERRTPANP